MHPGGEADVVAGLQGFLDDLVEVLMRRPVLRACSGTQLWRLVAMFGVLPPMHHDRVMRGVAWLLAGKVHTP